MNDARPQGRRDVMELLERHGRSPNKRLGQHFLVDPNLVDKIVRYADLAPGDHVVEVGAGTGTLTRGLAATGARVVAYEVDAGLTPVLEETVGHLPDVAVHIADVMNVDLASDLGPGEWLMVANLPYQVATPLLLDTLRDVAAIRRFVVMVQREVAARLRAAPGTKAYGVPSVVAALYADVSFGFTVPPQVFVPPPAVESAVISLVRKQPDPGAARAAELAAIAFQQRRKMVRRALRDDIPDLTSALAAAGIDPTRRPEDLAADDYLRLGAASP